MTSSKPRDVNDQNDSLMDYSYDDNSPSDNNGDNENSFTSLCTVEAFLNNHQDNLDLLSSGIYPVAASSPPLSHSATRNNNTDDAINNTIGVQSKDLSLSHTTDMAEERRHTNLQNIAHIVTMKLIKSIDTDKGWESLAANTGFKFEDICQLQLLDKKCGASATESLLWKLGCKGYTTEMLYDQLIKLERLHDAEILETYIRDGYRPSQSLAPSCRNLEGLPSILSRTSISNSSNPSRHGVVHGPAGAMVNYGSPQGSEINFNDHHSWMSKGQAKEKIIPGAAAVHSQMPYVFPGQLPIHPGHPAFYHSVSSSNNSSGGGSSQQDSFTRMLRPMGNQSPHSYQPPSAIHSMAEIAISMKTSFSYTDLLTATNGFNTNNILGEGGFGIVYKAYLRGFDCAVKRFSKRAQEKSSTEQIQSELAALLKYQNENIVNLYGYALDGPELCLVYQYLKNGSLEDRLMRKNNTPVLSWQQRINVLLGSCKAVSFLHTFGECPLIHGDIKSANILLDDHLEARLADLGQAQYATSRSTNTGGLTHITIQETTSRQYGSKAYQAPEVRDGCSMSIQSDIFAMGVVILEVCTGLMAYDYDRIENQFLSNLYTNHIKSLNEKDRVKLYQDKSPLDKIPSCFFTALLKLAGLCLKEIKKKRPNSEGLLKGLREIHKNLWQDAEQEQKPFHHKRLNSPTEDDLLEASELLNYHSHTCEGIFSSDCNSPAPHSTQRSSIVQMQHEKFKELSIQSSRNTVPSSQNTSNSPKSQIDGKTFLTSSEFQNGCRSTQGQDNKFTPLKLPSQQPSRVSQEQLSYLSSFSPNQPLPEAYLLQSHYDQRSSGQLQSQQEFLPSNPNSVAPSSVHNPVEKEAKDTNEGKKMASDPEKLSAMKLFDKFGFKSVLSNEEANQTSVSLKCDEAKMEYLTNFDERAFHGGRTSDGTGGIEEHSMSQGMLPSKEQSNQVINQPQDYLRHEDFPSSCCKPNTSNHGAFVVHHSETHSNGRAHNNSNQVINVDNQQGVKSPLFVNNDAQRLLTRENFFMAYENCPDDSFDHGDDDAFEEEVEEGTVNIMNGVHV